MANHRSRGNRVQQKIRWRKNNTDVPRQEFAYQIIDGNYTHHPYGYCSRYSGYLTKNMTKRHNCENKQCKYYISYLEYTKNKPEPTDQKED